jgi:hypothetical protein
LPESLFSAQLNKTLNSLENSKTNAISGFTACGIIPLDRNQILKRLPDSKIKDNKEVWSTTFEETLRVAREAQPIRQRYGTCYHSVLEAVYRLCNLNDDTVEFGKRSLPQVLRSAITILVKALSNSYLSKGLFNNSIDRQSEDRFLTLHCDNYGVYVGRAAGRTRPHQKAKWQIQLPNPKDTKLFSVYIAEEARKAYKNLKENGYAYDMWLRLGQAGSQKRLFLIEEESAKSV